MFRHSAAPSRHLVALIVGLTVVPLGVLLWLGWRLLDLDRRQEDRQTQQRLEQSAQLVVAALQRAVSSSRQQLAAGSEDWPEGAVAVFFRDKHVDSFPKGRVAYFPVVEPLREPAAGVFAASDEREYRKNDPVGAIALLSEFAKSPNPAVRAGALLRLGRNLANTDRVEEALAAYSELSDIDGVAIAGNPASLAGRYLRCDLFERKKRTAELKSEARLLDRDLRASRWPLIEASYRNYASDVTRWLGDAVLLDRGEAFEEAVADLWQQWHSLMGSGQKELKVGSRSFVVLWQSAGDSFRALIASPEFVTQHWIAPVKAVAQEQRVYFKLDEASDRPSPSAVRLQSTNTGLPWDVLTSPDSSVGNQAFVFRRRLLVAGFILLSLMTFTASYLIYRAIARELAVVRLQSDFVAAVSHEFRTPLTSLRQFTTMLRENPDLPKDRRVLSYDAQMRAADRLVSLVESLLDFGRMEAGAQRYEFEQRDCTELVCSTIDEFRKDPQAENYAIEFRGDDLVQTRADADALSRAIRNLLENAVKYSPDNRNLEVALSRNNGDVRIAVRDHGMGIPPQERVRIFKKFQRGEQAKLRGIKGTGIGLAMVAEIVKAHRGHVELESKPGQGSTFTIVLPAKD